MFLQPGGGSGGGKRDGKEKSGIFRHKLKKDSPFGKGEEEEGSGKKHKKHKKHRESMSSVRTQQSAEYWDHMPTTPVRGGYGDDMGRTPMQGDYGRPVSRGDDDGRGHPLGPRAPPSSSGNSLRVNGPVSFSSYGSSDGRQSFDQSSTFSSGRGSSIYETPPMINANTFSPSNFTLTKPDDDRIVEGMFQDLMILRGWTRFPEQTRRDMQNYNIHKKWTLVYQDKLASWQAEQKRRNQAGSGPDQGSPEWYVKKILDGTIDSTQLNSLTVSLRTQPMK